MEEEKQSILNFIEEIEHEKQEHFMSAYNQICENFSAIFSKLTGGGDGRLELQRPEDPFSGGVDLYIQFPGKPMRLASGASGGERSVAAIAYLLAIQRFLKAPFYLFDEIDAHLDDLNTSRLAEVLKENAADSQFLMISLKDVMVHNADRIYGVFAQNGRSRVLSTTHEGGEGSSLSKQKPYYLRQPWDILFRENKLERVSPWNINLVLLLASLLEEMEEEGIDFRLAGIAIQSSVLIYLQESRDAAQDGGTTKARR